MKIRTRTACVVLAASGIAAAAFHGLPGAGGEGGSAAGEQRAGPDPAGAGIPATMHFTDPKGNPRNPTAAEARAAARAFARDLDRMAGPHRDRPNVRTVPSGAVAATVATSRVSLLYAVETEDGTITIGHTTTNGDGQSLPANELPEE